MNYSNSSHCMNFDDYWYIMENNNVTDWTTQRSTRIIFGILYSTIFGVGFGGNMFVIVTVLKFPNLRTVRNFFIVNLSISDILVCCISLPSTSLVLTHKEWLVGEFMCYLVMLASGMTLIVSTGTLTAIAVDRYILIVTPTNPPLDYRKSTFVMVFIWMIAAVIASPAAAVSSWVDGSYFKANDSDTELCGHYCYETGWQDKMTLKTVYGYTLLSLQYIAPLLIISFCYLRIVIRLTQGMAFKRAKHSSKNTRSSRETLVMKRQRKTNSMLISMVAIFALSWLGVISLNIFRDLEILPRFVRRQEYFFNMLVHAIAMTSTCWNPFLYGFMNESFKKGFAELLPCLAYLFNYVEKQNAHPEETAILNPQSNPQSPSLVRKDATIVRNGTQNYQNLCQNVEVVIHTEANDTML